MASWRLFGKKERYGKTVRSSYLANHGWYLSLERHKALTAGSSHSAPLLPYALADILDPRITQPMTAYVRWDMHTYRWLLHRAHHVSSDHIAMHRMSDSKHGRFERIQEPGAEQSADYVQAHTDRFQVMIVDGPDKHGEIEQLLPMLTADGVLVLVDDLLDPFDYDSVSAIMKEKGFKTLDFTNPAPLYHELGAKLCYRDGNCLGI